MVAVSDGSLKLYDDLAGNSTPTSGPTWMESGEAVPESEAPLLQPQNGHLAMWAGLNLPSLPPCPMVRAGVSVHR